MSNSQVITRGRFLRLTAGALVLGACSEHQDVTDPGDGEVTEIFVRDNVFFPAQVTIARGETIRWRTQTATFHTVTPDGHAAFAERQFNANNATFDVTFNTAGTFPYYCAPHRTIGMTGTIVVT
jgi:plastocyanin